MIWLCPAGLTEDEVIVESPMEILHIYLPVSRFEQFTSSSGGRAVSGSSIRYLAGFHDELIRQIGAAMHTEMKSETSSGRLLIDCLALSLTARLAESYSVEGGRAGSTYSRHSLDQTRLSRVLEFVNAHIAEDLGLETLAGVACLSPFHFARMFRNSMGVPPHRYLSELRIARAKSLLVETDLTLVEIALESRFSSQANFSRAFRASTGRTPGAYRRAARYNRLT